MQLFSNGLLQDPSKMGLLKVCSWTQKVDRDCERDNEREDNNNTVKREFMRIPNRC